ncbi:MBL fold metallo-hydrolase [Flavobacteriaceae bacterium AU392]|nr:MBL fold metallo-hydrolase [Flavobacteriaceae bacterium]RKM86033.1 MBL fold metallo-hydrolase [Flavobacteriaceae bacterium AU392]
MCKSLFFSFLITALFNSCNSSSAEKLTDLNTQVWIHGSENCDTNTDPSIQVVQYNANTWILRQNKCLNYEAPFMFLFIGQEKTLLIDTGATKEAESFPLYNTVNKIIQNWQNHNNTTVELIVAHTHGHGDHFAADEQFQNKPNTTVIGLKQTDVSSFFNIKDWPNEQVIFNLGNRELNIIPIPGHQKASIAIYDPETQLLLTGDTVYPGRLYIEDWQVFKQSIKTLVEFTKINSVSYILGNHIEMTTAPGVDYPIGTKYHPEEQTLPLKVSDLVELHTTLETLGDTPTRKALNKLIIFPVN